MFCIKEAEGQTNVNGVTIYFWLFKLLRVNDMEEFSSLVYSSPAPNAKKKVEISGCTLYDFLLWNCITLHSVGIKPYA